LSEITQASNLTNSSLNSSHGASPSYAHNSAQVVDLKSANTTGVDLAPVLISPSQILWLLQVLLCSFMLIAASLAISSFIFTAFYWPMLLLSFAVLLILVLRSAWFNKMKPPIRLSVIQKIWRLQTARGEMHVELCDEILLWDAVIVLPVREILTRRTHRIVALSDSMSAEDWRRLRVWLRMGLKDNV
jgi:hypothetical protein